MTTPPPETPVAGETMEDTVKLIMVKCVSARGSVYRDQLRTEILSALRNEREACAKLLEKRRDQYALVAGVEADIIRMICTQLAAVIREGK